MFKKIQAKATADVMKKMFDLMSSIDARLEVQNILAAKQLWGLAHKEKLKELYDERK